MENYVNFWIMYHEVHRHHFMGMTPPQIGEFFVMDTRTVKKLLSMSEKEYEDYRERLSTRTKKLAPYEDFIKNRLEHCLEASSAQVHDWLKVVWPPIVRTHLATVEQI